MLILQVKLKYQSNGEETAAACVVLCETNLLSVHDIRFFDSDLTQMNPTWTYSLTQSNAFVSQNQVLAFTGPINFWIL